MNSVVSSDRIECENAARAKKNRSAAVKIERGASGFSGDTLLTFSANHCDIHSILTRINNVPNNNYMFTADGSNAMSGRA